jgi:hypothetical protein
VPKALPLCCSSIPHPQVRARHTRAQAGPRWTAECIRATGDIFKQRPVNLVVTYGSTRGSERYLDAHDDQGPSFSILEHGEKLRCGHRKKRLFDGAEVQRTQRGKAETIIGLPKGYSRERKGRCLSRGDSTFTRFARPNLSDFVR